MKRSAWEQDFAWKVTRTQSDRELNRRGRLYVIGVVACLWVGALLFRLYSLQIADFERWQEWALKQHISKQKLASERGPIFDRRGRLMAVSVPAGSVYVRPSRIRDKDTATRKLSEVLGLPSSHIRSALNKSEPFVWVKRQIPRVQAEQVEALGIKGAGYLLESRRYYPYNSAASTLVGRVGIDGVGLSGLEASHERWLQGDNLETRVTRDALGKIIPVDARAPGVFELPRGRSLALTLDAAVQVIVDEELARGQADANAKRALAVLIDAESGEILGLSQSPSPNFNSDRIPSRELLRNFVVESVFEPGSIVKPLVAAAALEARVASARDLIDCENGAYRFGAHIINDVHGSDTLSVHDVVVRSSNIGMTKIGLRLGRHRLFSALENWGFGRSSGLNLPGETSGILRHEKSWAKVDVATHSFGQGVAVTPLQIVRAFAAISNDGMMPELRLRLDDPIKPSRRVLSPLTAAAVKAMMVGVVNDPHGTGKRAAIAGFEVGGKTGTAQKARENGRGYAPGKYIASFVGTVDGAAQGIQKRFVLLVSIDEPDTTSIYGGTLAAPVFQRIMERVLNYFAVEGGITGSRPPVELAPRRPGLVPVSWYS